MKITELIAEIKKRLQEEYELKLEELTKYEDDILAKTDTDTDVPIDEMSKLVSHSK